MSRSSSLVKRDHTKPIHGQVDLRLRETKESYRRKMKQNLKENNVKEVWKR